MINDQYLFEIFRLLDNSFDDLGWYPGDNETEKLLGMILVQNTNFTNVRYSIRNLKDFFLLKLSLR